MSRPPASAIVIDEIKLESHFLEDPPFVREEGSAAVSADLVVRDSPFAMYGFDRAEPVADSAEPEAVEEEEPVPDVEPFTELDIAEMEQESPFEEPETGADFERLIEAQLGLTGDDDRREVPDTAIQPYRWICSVTYEKDGQTLDGGTGVLISNRHVLTAGHVITNARLGEPNAPSLVVYPGRHYGGEPFGRYLAARTRVPNFRLDFGLITLNRPVDSSLLWWSHPSTNSVWWSEAAIPLRDLRQREFPITTAGFPGAKDSYRRRMYEARGATVPSGFGGTFRHTADTTQGQSGSPIWTELGGRRILIGIVTGFDSLPNQIAVFAHDTLVQRHVQRWMAEDVPKPRPVERRIELEIPYRWVCRLEVYDNDLRRNVGYGTGLLISDRHVLTSARVIHEYSRNRRRYAVRITPGYEFGKEAFGSTTAVQARVSPTFSPATKDGSTDYGLLTLSRPLGSAVFSSIANSALGFWGDESHGLSTTAAELSGSAAHIAAFSRLSGGGARYHKLRIATGAIVGLQRGQILHRAGSKMDAPGAPIWIAAGKRRLLVGIASSVFSKDSELNLGCYMSQGTQNQLMQWINEDFKQTEIEVHDLSQDELELVLAAPDTEAEDRIGETNDGPGPRDEYVESEEKHAEHVDIYTYGEREEVERESPQDADELYSPIHEHENDQGEELTELQGTELLESHDEESNAQMEDSGEEESERDEDESVEAELEKAKGGPKKSSLHSVSTTDIFMHVYFTKLSAGYTRQQFFDWIVNQNPGEMGPNRFQAAGVEINLISNSSTAVSDFKRSLQAAGSVVVYFGHTVLGPKTTLGLTVKDPPAKKPSITCPELTTLLNVAKAKIVVLSGCATSDCVTRIKGDTVVIVTQSGKDRLTNTLQWAPAIKSLLDELLASGTVGDALAAANKSFAKASSTDSFKMINGDPTLKMN